MNKHTDQENWGNDQQNGLQSAQVLVRFDYKTYICRAQMALKIMNKLNLIQIVGPDSSLTLKLCLDWLFNWSLTFLSDLSLITNAFLLPVHEVVWLKSLPFWHMAIVSSTEDQQRNLPSCNKIITSWCNILQQKHDSSLLTTTLQQKRMPQCFCYLAYHILTQLTVGKGLHGTLVLQRCQTTRWIILPHNQMPPAVGSWNTCTT